MSNQNDILTFLGENKENYFCDDCLSEICNIHPRQTVYQTCTKLFAKGFITRSQMPCEKCKRIKQASSVQSNPGSSSYSVSKSEFIQVHNNKEQELLQSPLYEEDYGRSLEQTIFEFFRYIILNKVNIYNEFSLQHELGLFLRNYYSNIYVVEFEKNVESFDINKEDTIKKEIDITLKDKETQKVYISIELKCPTNGQIPEQMYSFCKDVMFLEQLVSKGFKAGYFIALVDSDLYVKEDSTSNNEIYKIFRKDKVIAGSIKKPTGNTNEYITVGGRYKIKWERLKDGRYFTIIKVI